jgi:hypothetical protein
LATDAQPDGAERLRARLYVRSYGKDDVLGQTCGPEVVLDPAGTDLAWDVPELGGGPIAETGIEVLVTRPGPMRVYLDALGWSGAPSTVFRRPEQGGSMWRRAWVDAVDQWDARWGPAFRVIQNRGRGLISQGTADWQDYRVSATLTPQLCKAAGLAARIGGLRRYYALLVEHGGGLRLERNEEAQTTTLASRAFDWHWGESHEFALELRGSTVRALFDGRLEFAIDDSASTLRAGGVGLVVAEGRLDTEAISVEPIDRQG